MVLVVGVTGGIGSGKTAATDCFAALGIPILNADQTAKQVVAPNTQALSQIASYFGKELITAEGALDRATLRTIIFADPQAKQWLEDLIHPLVEQSLKEWLARLKQAKTNPYVIIESPLLLETNQHQLVDRVLVVDAGPDQQITRASYRDKQTHAQIKAIMDTQLSRQARLEKADYVIDNTGNLDQLNQHIHTLHQHIMAGL